MAGAQQALPKAQTIRLRSLNPLSCDPLWGPLPPCGQEPPCLHAKVERRKGRGLSSHGEPRQDAGLGQVSRGEAFARVISRQQSLGRWGRGGPSPRCHPHRVNRTNVQNGARKAVPGLDPTWAQTHMLRSHGKAPVYFGWSSVFVLCPYPSLVKCGAVLISRSPGT